MTQEAGYTIGQLAKAGGVTPRTIRFYTAEGLLPPPDIRGRFARYSDIHLQRLHWIARLKRDYLPLSVIRERLESLTDTQLAALTLDEENPSAAAAGNALLEQGSEHPGLQEPQSWEPQANPDQTFPSIPMLPEGAESALMVASPGRKRVVLLISPMFAPSSDLTSESPGREAPLFEASDTWQHITLAPGVELHIRIPDSPQTFDALNRLIQETKALFQSLR